MARATQTTVTGCHESMSKQMAKITRRSLTITMIKIKVYFSNFVVGNVTYFMKEKSYN